MSGWAATKQGCRQGSWPLSVGATLSSYPDGAGDAWAVSMSRYCVDNHLHQGRWYLGLAMPHVQMDHIWECDCRPYISDVSLPQVHDMPRLALRSVALELLLVHQTTWLPQHFTLYRIWYSLECLCITCLCKAAELSCKTAFLLLMPRAC